MKRMTVLGILSLAFTVPANVVAQDPARRDTAQQGEDPYMVGMALPPLDPGATLAEMTLEQAIERALQANLDIQIARLEPSIQGYALDAARAAFSPTLSATYGYQNSTNQSTSQLDGGARTNT
ncbi:MAG: TolC family protein, partial [Longimicrobiales bacterium]